MDIITNIIAFISGSALVLGVICYWKLFFADEQCDCLENLKKYPYGELLGTRFGEFLEIQIEFGIILNPLMSKYRRDLDALAEALGYQQEHQEEKTIWEKI